MEALKSVFLSLKNIKNKKKMDMLLMGNIFKTKYLTKQTKQKACQ